MADRYWVGNGGNWSDTNRWSETSGGSSGATVPTFEDDTYFNALSFDAPSTITLDVSAFCKNFDWTNLSNTVTFSSSANHLYIYGDVSLYPGLTWTFTSNAYVYFKAIDTSIYISNNGVSPTLTRLYLDSSTMTVINRDHFLLSGSFSAFYPWQGHWNTNDCSVTSAGGLTILNAPTTAGVRSFKFGSSIIQFLSHVFSHSGWQSLDAGTSTIITTGGAGSGSYLRTGTYYNVEARNYSITGQCTFNNLTHRRTSTSVTHMLLGESGDTSIAINGTLFASGEDASTNRCYILTMVSRNTPCTIIANDVSLANVDFFRINASGTADWDLSSILGGSGDAGGNTGITFTPTVSCYFVHTSGSVNYCDDSKWRTASGGVVQARTPIPQDNAIFDANSFSGSSAVTVPSLYYWMSSIDMSTVNQPVTLSNSATSVRCIGHYILGENVTLLNPTIVTHLHGIGDFNFNIYNNYINRLSISAGNGVYTNHSNFSTATTNSSGRTFEMLLGTFDFNDYDVCTGYLFLDSNLNAHLYLGNGTVTLSAYGGYQFYAGLNGNLYAENSTIRCNPIQETTSNILFYNYGSNKILNNLQIYNIKQHSLNITMSMLLNNLYVDAGCKVNVDANRTITILNKFIASGTSDASITLGSITSGSFARLNASTNNNFKIQLDKCFIQDLSVGPIDKWYAQNSTDLGGNTGWIFDRYDIRRLRVGNTPLSMGVPGIGKGNE